jgi:hypothetical protein
VTHHSYFSAHGNSNLYCHVAKAAKTHNGNFFARASIPMTKW